MRWYKSKTYAAQSYNQDTYLIQLGASILETNQFIRTMICRFDLDYFFQILPTPPDVQRDVVAGEFLSELILILTDRFQVAYSYLDQFTRRFVIHALSVSNKSRAKIVEHIPRKFGKNKALDTILTQVADKKEDTGLGFKMSTEGSTTYCLKLEAWSEFEGEFFPYWNQPELEKAKENYGLVCKKHSSLSNHFPKPFSLNFPEIQLPEYNELSSFAHSTLIHELIWTVLFNCVRNCSASEQLMSKTLTLLYILLQMGKECDKKPPSILTSHPTGTFTWAESNLFSNLSFCPVQSHPVSILRLLFELSQSLTQREHVALLKEMLTDIQEKDQVCKDLLIKWRSETTENQKEDEDKPHKLKSEQRKQQLMARLKLQQSKVLENFSYISGEEVEEADEEFECCLCRETSKHQIMSQIGRVQRSTVLQSLIKSQQRIKVQKSIYIY